MDIKEAMGYVQAVADNCNDAPRYQRALQTVLDYVEASYNEQNRLLGEIAAQHELIAGLSDELSQRNLTIESLNDSLASVCNELECVLSTNKELKRKQCSSGYLCVYRKEVLGK